MARQTRVVIVGGGLSGLSSAWELTEWAKQLPYQPLEIAVVESSAEFGRRYRSRSFHPGAICSGPDLIHVSGAALRTLADEVGYDAFASRESAPKLAWSDGHSICRFLDARGPLSVIRNLTRAGVISATTAVRTLGDFVLPKVVGRWGSELTVAQVANVRLGKAFTQQAVGPFISALTNGVAHEVSMGNPMLSSNNGSGTSSLLRKFTGLKTVSDETMETLVDLLTKELCARGVVFHNNAVIRQVRRRSTTESNSRKWEVSVDKNGVPIRVATDLVLFATSPRSTAMLLQDIAPDAARSCGDFVSSSVATVRLAYFRSSLSLPRYANACAVQPDQDALMTGCAWHSPEVVEGTDEAIVNLRVIVGRRYHEDFVNLSDEEIVARVQQELRSSLSVQKDPLHASVERWDDAFVQWEPGHRERIRNVQRQLEDFDGLAAVGLACNGAGVDTQVDACRRDTAKITHTLLHDRHHTQVIDLTDAEAGADPTAITEVL